MLERLLTRIRLRRKRSRDFERVYDSDGPGRVRLPQMRSEQGRVPPQYVDGEEWDRMIEQRYGVKQD